MAAWIELGDMGAAYGIADDARLECGAMDQPRTADEAVSGLDLSDKRFIVTGANTGIGFETARALCSAGGSVTFACRSLAKSEEAVTRATVLHPGCRAKVGVLDLASAASVQSFVAASDAETLHGLICNAGLISMDYQETADGLELTVGVCHYGHFMLTRLLMGRLLASGSPRIVVVSSESHRSPRTIDFDRFPLPRDDHRMMLAYGQAKLANVLFAKELHRRYGKQGVVACSLHPGTLVTTDIGRQSLVTRALMRMVSPFTKSPNQGAATSVWAATSGPAERVRGQYLVDCAVGRPAVESQDAGAANLLWQVSDEWCHNILGDESPWPPAGPAEPLVPR